MASSNSGISFIQVYKRWLSADQHRNRDSTIPINIILLKLIIREVLIKPEYQMVDHEKTDEGKNIKLFLDIMPAKGEQGFNKLMVILKENNYNDLATDLAAEWDKSLTDVSPAAQNQLIPIQTHLSRLIKENIDFMAKYWSDVIPLAQTNAAFVQVQVLNHFKAQKGYQVYDYRKVFDKDEKAIHNRILIQADPGCGKTTYVNKLALDWANDDEYLRKKFDLVFLIALQTLTMDMLDAINCFLPEKSEQFFASYAKSCDSKILLILDGFDELKENSVGYSSVMNILEGKSMQFQFFNLIVTTRRSHNDRIPQPFRARSLLIEGFDEASMKEFLAKQGVPLPSVGQQSNLNRLLQTPLFCAIYCSLHFGEGDPIELEDSYDLIKAMVANSVTNTTVVKKKTVVNEKEQLDEIGKFAFQMLDSASLDFLKRFCRSFEVTKPSFDLSSVNLDLLIKRRIPSRGVGGFKEELAFPHKLIAEYLAARYFARSLTKEQMNPTKAVLVGPASVEGFSTALDFPFVRFFLFELLLLYLEKKYEERVFDNYLNIPKLRFIWNCKSNKDIRTLDNVSDLDFKGWNKELINHSRFIPTLSKCRNISSLRLSGCQLSKNQVEQIVKFINDNFFQKFSQLDLSDNENIGSSTDLFRVLHKCRQLRWLYLFDCSMTQESLNIFLTTFNSNTFQKLDDIRLWGNEKIKVDDTFFTALEKCPKISKVVLSEYMKSDLREVGRKAKKRLEQRRCEIQFSHLSIKM